MIIATSKSDTMLKKAVGKGQTSIISIQKMLDQFALDPTITEPKRDAYIVTNEDISAARLKQHFEQALLTKHPATRVIFINKTSKPMYPNGLPGCNVILQKPKPQDIAQSISSVIDMAVTREAVNQYQGGLGVHDASDNMQTVGIQQAPVDPNVNNPLGYTEGSFDTKTNQGAVNAGSSLAGGNQIGVTGDVDPSLNGKIPAYTPNSPHANTDSAQVMVTTVQGETIEAIKTTKNDGTVSYTDLNGMPIEVMPDGQQEIPMSNYGAQVQQTGEELPVMQDSAMAQRIRQAGTVSDISVITREMTAAALIKDLINSNSTYAGVEEKLRALNNAIFAVFQDTSIPTLDAKLSRVHAMLHDKAFYAAKGDTLIEQRLEEVIDTVCVKTSELIQSRLNEIDTAINKAAQNKDVENMSPRLAGLNEERANLIIELKTLEFELTDIYKNIDMLAMDVAGTVAENSDNITGNEHLNTHIKAHQTNVVSEETVTAIRTIVSLPTEKANELFNELRLKIIAESKLLDKIFELDQEIIAAQQAVINYLKANKVEDTVLAESLLKKSLRVFIGCEHSGRTIIPYLLSKYKANQNSNVLVLDLTGTGKYANYGIQYQNLDTYLAELNQKPFHLVAGTLDNTVQAAQRIVTSLLKAADYYRVINVILNTEQRELFETIAQDVLCVNYLVDTNANNINKMKDVIAYSRFENVARRVIINRCDIPIRTIITRLGLDNEIDFGVCTVPTIPELTDASLNYFNPYGIGKVDFAMEEVLKHA